MGGGIWAELGRTALYFPEKEIKGATLDESQLRGFCWMLKDLHQKSSSLCQRLE